MIKRSSRLACAAFMLWALSGAQGTRAAAPQDYVKPATLFRVRLGAERTAFGGSVILTTDASQVRALEKLEGTEVITMGAVYDRQMPNTQPLYRLSKPGTRPSPERFYTTDKRKVEDLVKNHGWAPEGILCYVTLDAGAGTKPLYHLTRSGEHFYTTDDAEMRRYRDKGGYRDEGVEARIGEHFFEVPAEGLMFADSAPGPGAPGPESYALICRRGKGASFGADGVYFKFIKGAEKAGAALAAGECAWPDRSMSAGEPDVLLAPLTNYWRPLKWGEDRDSEYWTFKVYNDGRGHMVVTGAEPGRPPVQEGNSVEVNRDVNVPEVKRPDVKQVPRVRPPKP